MTRFVKRLPGETMSTPDSEPSRLPVWVRDAITVIGVVLAIIGVGLAMTQVFNEEEPEPEIVIPEAFIEEVVTGSDAVKANGSFRYVDLAAEVILFVRIDEGADGAPFLPVRASVAPDAQSSGDRVDGHWDAAFPLNEEGVFSWQVLIAKAAAFGFEPSGGYDDIRLNGPDSEFVVGASEVFTPIE